MRGALAAAVLLHVATGAVAAVWRVEIPAALPPARQVFRVVLRPPVDAPPAAAEEAERRPPRAVRPPLAVRPPAPPTAPSPSARRDPPAVVAEPAPRPVDAAMPALPPPDAPAPPAIAWPLPALQAADHATASEPASLFLAAAPAPTFGAGPAYLLRASAPAGPSGGSPDLLAFRDEVGRRIGETAERAFRRLARREEEGVVRLRVRVAGAGPGEIVSIEAASHLLSSIIEGAVRTTPLPSPPVGLDGTPVLAFRFRFVLE